MIYYYKKRKSGKIQTKQNLFRAWTTSHLLKTLKKKTKEQCKQISVSYMNKMQDYVQKRKPLTAESYSYILFGNDQKKSAYWSPEKKITKQNLQQLDDLS